MFELSGFFVSIVKLLLFHQDKRLHIYLFINIYNLNDGNVNAIIYLSCYMKISIMNLNASSYSMITSLTMNNDTLSIAHILLFSMV